MNNNRFTFKFLGILMEAINITPKEIRKTIRTVAKVLFIFLLIYIAPSLISAVANLIQVLHQIN